MRVLKFGGSSVATPQRIKDVIRILNTLSYKDMAVVVSAFGGVTDQLIKLAQSAAAGKEIYHVIFKELEKRHLDAIRELIDVHRQSPVLAEAKVMINELEDLLHGIFLIRELSLRTLDVTMSFGERLSAFIIAHALKEAGMETEFLDARTLIRTDNNFGSAMVNFEETNHKIQNYFDEHKGLQVVTGFIGSTSANETTTLGRSGSDYTAAIFAAALDAEEVEIWTDVDGMMTADPRKVKKAFSISSLSYYEAIELSHFGAKVIFPSTMHPVMAKKIPIRVKNTFNPSFEGTVIHNKESLNPNPQIPNHKPIITGISSISNVLLARLEGSGLVGVVGTAGRLFGALAREKVNVILISQASSEHSICFVVDPASAEHARQAVETEFIYEINAGLIEPLVIEENKTVVAAVGENMKNHPGTSGRMFASLGKNGVNISAIAQGSSELNISAVVDRHDEVKALNALHEGFFLSDKKSLNVFLVGTGLIGKVLLTIMQKQLQKLAEEHRIELHLAAVANTRKMLFDEDGIAINNWQEELEGRGEVMNMDEYVERMNKMNLTNSVFVDCTANDNIIRHYEQVMRSNISIVTPNKRANSGSYSDYQRLKEAASVSGVRFLYETNVGAGLPVISTLNDLMYSGDHILRIEAVLSGTMNFLFSNYTTGQRFSEIVKLAKEKGYTEPDPRDDLSGMDVARKILILAREMGLPLEPEQIEVKGLVPEDCKEIKTVEEFFKKFEKHDAEFEKLIEEADKEKKKLRYMATVENGKATVSLVSVDDQHPFYSLKGSDNIVSFTTRRYNENPLIVRGPGAGAEVTAAGVFADIIRIVNFLTP